MGKKAVAAVLASAMLMAACSSGKTSTSPTTVTGSATTVAGPTTTVVAKPTGTVNIANVYGNQWTCGFNPFNNGTQSLGIGLIYEPLVFINILQNGKETPMLATGYQWSADHQTLTFTMRDGVKWTDGQPLTAADVAFTFQLMKKDPAADTQSVWSTGLQTVTATGNQVVFVWNTPALPYLYYVADLTGIVPQHIWSTGDLYTKVSQALDDKPVGSGPFVVGDCNPQLITYTANPNYWMPNEPHVAKILYPYYADNAPANLDLALGKGQWGGQYIAGMQTAYADKDPANNHFWNPPTTNVGIFFNVNHKISGNLAIRQAIAYGIDRKAVATVGEGGLQNPGNQCGVVLPNFKDWYDAASCDGQYGYDQAKAKQLLASQGYSPAHPLKLTILTIQSYTDWDASLQEIKSELAPIGINLTVLDQDNSGTYLPNLQKGNFDLAYGTMPSPGPNPWYELRQMLFGPNVGSTNYSQLKDPAVDALFNQFAGTSDVTAQKSIVKQLEQVMLTKIPMIPTTESVNWSQYNTKNLTGWSTPDNQYAMPAPYAWPDVEQVALHLQFKG